jgi:glycosyltransferase involved in cell wall biosynthesis
VIEDSNLGIEGKSIGIVTSFLGNLRAGTWVYTRNLLQGLSGKGVVRVDREERLLEGLEGIPAVVAPGGGRLAKLTWPNLQLPEVGQRAGLDLVHVTTPYGCFRRTGFRKIITICDVTPLLFPGAHGRMNVWHHRHILPIILRQADHIITISEASKRDIMRLYRVAEEKVTVTLLAADRRFTQNASLPAVRLAEYPYILNVGTLEPRKNLPCLLMAFAAARRKGLPHRLVVTGASGWGDSPLVRLIDELELHADVIFTGFIGDEELPSLYAGADFFVYPSLYEGFGLPVLEAMASGTPVITSNVSSLPEVAGAAALLVDPRSQEEISAAMLRLAGDGELWNSMREQGKIQASRFSWERTTQETWDLYEKVLYGK